jgi:hypothetical protein
LIFNKFEGFKKKDEKFCWDCFFFRNSFIGLEDQR